MLSPARFRELVDSYGADLRRWPPDVRDEARALMDASPGARDLLAAAKRLDAAIDAGAREDAARWQMHRTAALDRLRSGIQARIASAAPASATWRTALGLTALGRAFAGNPAWRTLALGSGVAVIAGLLIGGFYNSASPSDTLLSMLEPAPIHFLAD
jgi:hypothetical protein